ncbi:uncharacterized protein BO66DRAFT_396432 [Aspergillus aculeatinus CBS 121060]|uniref:Uncharacterized protein n=1 Tax=Aspergillus aculeatinus CBS 121060 TaxID=1448322 RepID=A0ACD1GSC8_9EURO|nr:hypothetical protein BO66DRAFT_396432 [Aspergillus aculeatinus CBS 121060]RAH64161.1 hypothetical protein BO66DRAFT_396432 [Aspergillus aculeatinus CBS 121060]
MGEGWIEVLLGLSSLRYAGPSPSRLSMLGVVVCVWSVVSRNTVGYVIRRLSLIGCLITLGYRWSIYQLRAGDVHICEATLITAY